LCKYKGRKPALSPQQVEEKGLLSFARARPNVLSALCCSYWYGNAPEHCLTQATCYLVTSVHGL